MFPEHQTRLSVHIDGCLKGEGRFSDMTSSVAAQQSASAASSDENDGFTDYARAILLNTDKSQVLMLHANATWDLPYFVYRGTLNFAAHRFCKDLQIALGIKSRHETDFNVVFEMLGSFASAEDENGGEPGYLQLMVVEYRASQTELDRKLPPHAAWKDAAFVSELLESTVVGDDYRVSLEQVLQLLRSPQQYLLSMREPRHQFGWYQRASQLLSTVATESGCDAPYNVVQMLLNPTSTILRADCENGSCFLKSPVLGSREAEITRQLGKIFPDSTPEVLTVDANLNAFVTRGFFNAKLSDEDALGISLELGRLQISSLDYLKELIRCQ